MKSFIDALTRSLHIAQALRGGMKRFFAILFAAMMIPLSGCIPAVAASTPTLVDAGFVQEIEPELVHWEVMNDGNILTVDSTGNLSVNSFTNGVVFSLWSLDLNVSANSARLDSAQQLALVCHDSGLLVVHIGLQIANFNISTNDPVNDADWDDDGDIWLAYFAGRRRAEEYNYEGSTGVVSPQAQMGFNAFDVLSDGRIVIGSYDKKVYISSNDGVGLTALTEPNAIITSVFEDHSGNLLVGTTNGMLYRYDTNSWAVETLSISHGSSIVSIEEYGNSTYHLGTQNGKLTQVDFTAFTEGDTFDSSGSVIGSIQAFTGQMYIASTFISSTKIRLYDLDTDGDGVTDQLDAFPLEFTQSVDADGDGYGDNPNGYLADVFPNEPSQHADTDGDGYGDNPSGFEGDAFPNNPDQWQDSDSDGYGDNRAGIDGDQFKNEPTQWADTDQDGFGDNPNGITPDACPTVNGFSKFDRFGCLDSDLDGYSNPTENWTILQGADSLPNQGTQWFDQDSDGYGDNATGLLADACPWEAGTSTKAWIVNSSASVGFVEVPSYGCKDEDGDGWVDQTESLGMETNPDEHFDADKDGVGSNADYDDSRPLVQTEEDHCMLNFDDETLACQGWRNSEYQSYLDRQKDANETDLSFSGWNASKNAGLLDESSVDPSTVQQVVFVGGGAFLFLTVIILVVGFIAKRRKTNSFVKQYGVPFIPPSENSAENEALEGTAGLSAQGGVVSDSAWDDDIEELNFTVQSDSDEAVSPDSTVADATELYGDEDSLESIAGIDAPPAEPVSLPAAVETEPTPSSPPLPESGLPEGWTMDQWKWYGQEWLDKNS